MLGAVLETESTGTLVLLAIAALGSMTTIVVALINKRDSRVRQGEVLDGQDAAHAAATNIAGQLATGNGHTLGEAIARMEAQGNIAAARLNAVESLVRETHEDLGTHLAEAAADRIAFESFQAEWNQAKTDDGKGTT